ncbi:hypothetical protein MTO96_003218 [Rhipicephalus appendiculatus]
MGNAKRRVEELRHCIATTGVLALAHLSPFDREGRAARMAHRCALAGGRVTQSGRQQRRTWVGGRHVARGRRRDGRSGGAGSGTAAPRWSRNARARVWPCVRAVLARRRLLASIQGVVARRTRRRGEEAAWRTPGAFTFFPVAPLLRRRPLRRLGGNRTGFAERVVLCPRKYSKCVHTHLSSRSQSNIRARALSLPSQR